MMSALIGYALLGCALAVAVAAWITHPLWGRRDAAPPRAAHDLQVAKRQLAEIDRDVARGAMEASEAEGARREISRRLLAAADALERTPPTEPATPKIGRLGAAFVVAIVAFGGVGFYAVVGSFGTPDQGLAERSFQAELETQAAALRAREGWSPQPFPPAPEGFPSFEEIEATLRAREAETPDTPEERRLLAQAQILLAPAMLQTGRYAEAWRLYARAIALLGPSVDPALFGRQAEAMVLAAGGWVTPEAMAALRNGPQDLRAAYFRGLAIEQQGQGRRAIAVWLEAIADARPDPFLDLMRAEIVRVAQREGLAPGDWGVASPLGDPSAPGPTADDVAAAAERMAEDQRDRIEGMVAGLAERLETQPRDIEGWLRLIRSYGVLGRPEDAARAERAAAEVFADDAAARAALREAALLAGVDG